MTAMTMILIASYSVCMSSYVTNETGINEISPSEDNLFNFTQTAIPPN